MDVAGTLIRMELGLALQLFGRARATGLLTVRSGEREAQLVLADGAVLHATSSTTSKLGECLVARGIITRAVLEDALRHQRRKKVKQPLGTILHELGVVSKAVAEAEIETMITRVLKEAFSWGDSQVRFESTKVKADQVLWPDSCRLEEILARLAWAPSRV